jgi:hypothetical protein
MKLFIAQESAWAAQPAELSPVLAFHWEGISVSEREAGRANPASPFTLTDQPGSADIHVLPYEWNYYIWTQKINEARAQAMQAAIYDKQILVWHSGDLPPIIPLPNAICFQSALYRSRLRANQHAVPFFVADPLPQHSNGQVKLRRKGERPVVGFCGYAGVVLPKMAYGVYANLKHNLLFRLGRAPYEAMPVLPATLLRARTLRLLSTDSRIETNFLINKRAFKRNDKRFDAEIRARQVATFYRNLLDSDYILCVRGYGNWSIRFYETLACGRIPVFIDTDCVLPSRARIPWKNYCVYVEQHELAHIAERILEFHARLTPDEFIEKQLACRQLWEERLSRAGFMNHLAEELISGAPDFAASYQD